MNVSRMDVFDHGIELESVVELECQILSRCGKSLPSLTSHQTTRLQWASSLAHNNLENPSTPNSVATVTLRDANRMKLNPNY